MKLSIFIDYVIIYTKNSKESMKKLLELKSEFSEVLGYKVYKQKLIVFLDTCNEQLEIEIF